MTSAIDHRLLRARVLVELGCLPEAELEVAQVLAGEPARADALSLFAKIKHQRGELSQAIACWMQLHLLRSPVVACLELDRALALVHQGHVDEARAWCIAIASAHRHRDLQIFRRAALALARIDELRGDLASARVQLEEIGVVPGLEQDLERLLALVRIYDRIGTVDVLEAASRICRHVIGERPALLGQLAALERRLGRTEIATELEARFLEATRRRMHRASLHDLVRLASLEYLPLAQLRAARPAGVELPPELASRELALVHAVHGETAPARSLFADGGELIDRKYLAELAAEAGDDARAIGLFRETFAADPADPLVVGWLLDRHARAPVPEIASLWRDPDRRAHTFELLEASCRLAPHRVETWRRLATLHELAGRADQATTCAARAHALALAQDRPIGRVLAAGVYRLADKPKGLLHEIWVHRVRVPPGTGGVLHADDIHGNITPELRAAIRSGFLAVREYARAKLPDLTADLDDFTYSYKLPKEDEQSGGLSAGLPSALAFLSVFLQRPIARTLASSGALISEAHDVITISKIGDAEHKVRAAYDGNLRTLLLPLANRAELERSTLVPHAITCELVHYAADLDHAVKLAFDADVFTRV